MLILTKKELQDVRENYHGNTQSLAKKYCTNVPALKYLARKHGFSQRKRAKQVFRERQKSESEFFDIDNFQIY